MPRAVWAGDGFELTLPVCALSSVGLAGPEAHAYKLILQRKEESCMLRDLRTGLDILRLSVWELQ
jgi:hypothetical protein